MYTNKMCSYDIRSELVSRGLSSSGNLATVRERLRADNDARLPIANLASSGIVTGSRAAASRVTVPSETAAPPVISQTITVTREAAVEVTTTTTTTPVIQIAQPSQAVVVAARTMPPTLPVPVGSSPTLSTPSGSPAATTATDMYLTLREVMVIVQFVLIVAVTIKIFFEN